MPEVFSGNGRWHWSEGAVTEDGEARLFLTALPYRSLQPLLAALPCSREGGLKERAVREDYQGVRGRGVPPCLRQ